MPFFDAVKSRVSELLEIVHKPSDRPDDIILRVRMEGVVVKVIRDNLLERVVQRESGYVLYSS